MVVLVVVAKPKGKGGNTEKSRNTNIQMRFALAGISRSIKRSRQTTASLCTDRTDWAREGHGEKRHDCFTPPRALGPCTRRPGRIGMRALGVAHPGKS